MKCTYIVPCNVRIYVMVYIGLSAQHGGVFQELVCYSGYCAVFDNKSCDTASDTFDGFVELNTSCLPSI